jgi:hypothetical protein
MITGHGDAQIVRTTGAPCSYAGWSSTKGPTGVCRPVQRWDREACPANQVMCNPSIFKSGGSSRGICVPAGGSPTQSCLQRAPMVVSRYLNDQGFRKQAMPLLGQDVAAFCRTHRSHLVCNPREVQGAQVQPNANETVRPKICPSAFRNPLTGQPLYLTKDVERVYEAYGITGPVDMEDVDFSTESFLDIEDEDSTSASVANRSSSTSESSPSSSFDPSEHSPREYNDSERPRAGGRVNTILPSITLNDEARAREAGYYTYGQDRKRYGTERTIWRIQEAGKALAEQDLIMSVGNISLNGGGRMAPHVSHQRGVDVDLRFVGPSGRGVQCNIGHNRSCFDREKTFQMVKALIDTDPENVRRILINDAGLARMVNTYYREATGTNRTVAAPCGTTAHNDHIHFSWNN